MINNTHQFGPTSTPIIIKILMSAIAITSLLCALIFHFFPGIDLFSYLALTTKSLTHGFVWQFITFLFLVPSSQISVGFFISLGFNVYIFWVISTALISRTNLKQFLGVLILSCVASASIALLVMFIGYPFYAFAGNTSIIISFLIVWVMLNPYSQLYLFFALTLKTKFLILVFLIVTLYFTISNRDLVSFSSYLFTAICAYFYSLFVWQGRSHISFLNNFETKLTTKLEQRKWKKEEKKTKKDYIKTKIYDFKTGKAKPNDDEFMDAMLKKISESGEKSLTAKERKKMKEISKRKKEEKN
jgi:hypothetical protein